MAKRTITCRCEHSFDVDVPEVVDISPGSDARREILEGAFLTLSCPRCGDELKPEFDMSFESTARPGRLFLVPEISRDRFLFGSYPSPEGVEVVIGFFELRERLLLADDGYDHRPIELLKYQILLRSGKSSDVRIYYQGTDQGRLMFHIHGLRDEDIAVMRLPESAYERAQQDVEKRHDEEPLRTILEPPYVSAHKVEVEREPDPDA